MSTFIVSSVPTSILTPDGAVLPLWQVLSIDSPLFWGLFFLVIALAASAAYFGAVLRPRSLPAPPPFSNPAPSAGSAADAEIESKTHALESCPDGIAIIDRSGCFTFVNRGYAARHGFDPSEIVGRSWRLLFPPHEIARFERTIFPSLNSDGTLRVEALGLSRSGATHTQDLSLSTDSTGAIVCIARDAISRDDAAREAEHLALFAEFSPNLVLRFDLNGAITFANPAARRVLEMTPAAAATITRVLDVGSRFDARGCIERGESHSCSARINQRHYNFFVRGLSEHGFGHAYGSDVTDLKRAHQKLIDSRKFLRKVIDANPNFIFVKDSRGRYTLANKAVADAYGTTVGALVGRTDEDFAIPSAEIERAKVDDAAVIERCEHRFTSEQPLTDAAKKTRWLQVVKKPIVMNRTGEVRVLGVATDITERKILQDQLLQSQKMEAIGQLAGGISHDFNNLLTGILGYTALLKMTNERLPEVVKTAELIENTANRAAGLTQKLLGFARKGKHHNVPVNLHTTIDETLAILQRTIEKNISIRLNCGAANPLVLGDPVQLQQVILNLAINARDSMCRETGGADGGTLTIATDLVTLGSNTLLPEPGLKLGTYLEITVRDTGCGIPPENRERIFEPFFTTKEPDRGTGMGLAMVYGIVQNHSGAISVYSVEGRGSVFRILLPAAEALPAALPTVLPAPPPRGKGQILVVDDHPVVRQVTARMLTALGYSVTTAHDGMEALEYYRTHVDDVDLVLIDMVMPRMGARECFRALKGINPGVRAILSTGYVKNNAVQEIMTEGMAGFVQKPYALNHLAEIVERVLRSDAGPPSSSEAPPPLLPEPLTC